MKKTTIILTIIILAINIYAKDINKCEGFEDKVSGINDLKGYKIECFVNQIAETINESLPKKIDSLTTIVSAEAKDKILIYNYKIAELPQEFQNIYDKNKIIFILNQVLTKNYCLDDKTRILFKKGITIKNIYFNNKNKKLFQNYINEEKCKKLYN